MNKECENCDLWQYTKCKAGIVLLPNYHCLLKEQREADRRRKDEKMDKNTSGQGVEEHKVHQY